MERTLILYHGNCPDGFSGAYAAWKKFGDTAEYLPLNRGGEVPDGVEGADVYMIDFTCTKPVMDEILARAASLVVLDHHMGVKEIVESMPEYVFDTERSGATIAWSYFHPTIPVPLFLQFIEDEDIYRHAMPDTPYVRAYLDVRPYSFEDWDNIVNTLENPDTRDEIIEKGKTYAEYFALMGQVAVR
ncbi:hypothetical protein KKH81_03030, partial [Patescibacteria group bacterium]|nr:hypothetical protein [Patescibacteria group bacterium]